MGEDFLIVGGGVVGLSLAWELASSGQRVRILDRSEPGREASWAGAGILPPARRRAGQHASDALAGLSRELHAVWASRLREATGIDTEYRECGGVYLGRTAGEAAALRGLQAMWAEQDLVLERLDAEELGQRVPALDATRRTCLRAAYWAPQEARLRNPRHLKALLAACRRAGVVIEAGTAVQGWTIEKEKVKAVVTGAGSRSAGAYCIAAGAWSGPLLRQQGCENGILPIRGQMVLFRVGATALRCVVNEGSRYLTPRDDGRLLVGSTEEEVGFHKATTQRAIEELIDLALTWLPGLTRGHVERTWSGLRPGTFDGLPYLGRLPAAANLYVAAGHFRSGLFLSPATAQVMAQLMTGRPVEVDLAPFRPTRG